MDALISFLMNHSVTLISAPPLLGIGGIIGYFAKRKIEGKGKAEEISHLSAVADLHTKLNKTGLTLAGLREFQAEALGKSAGVAVATAQRYVAVAEQLSEQAELAKHDGEWSGAGSQMEMNELSSAKAAQADEELTAIYLRREQELEGEGLALLGRSQLVWQQYRTAEVEREGQAWRGGSIQPLMMNLKYEAITRQRIAALASDLEGEQPPVLVVTHPKTPPNLLEIIVPTIPQARVRELLGVPSYMTGNRWQYRYEETQVEIAFNDSSAVDSVIVALCSGQKYTGTHPGADTDAPLGQLTLWDVIENYPEPIQYRESLRTKEIYVSGRWGPPGAWTYYAYGTLYINTGVGNLCEVDFTWDKTTNRLSSDPKKVLVNWMALMSTYGEPPGFDWFIKN